MQSTFLKNIIYLHLTHSLYHDLPINTAIVRPNRMHTMRAIAHPIAWASVSQSTCLTFFICYASDCSYSLARRRHFDATITTLL